MNSMTSCKISDGMNEVKPWDNSSIITTMRVFVTFKYYATDKIKLCYKRLELLALNLQLLNYWFKTSAVRSDQICFVISRDN